MKLLNTIIGLLIIPASLFAANVNITIKGIGEVGQGTPSKKNIETKVFIPSDDSDSKSLPLYITKPVYDAMVAGAVNGEKWDFVSNKGDQSIIAVAGGHKGWASFDGSMAASDLVDVVNNGYGSDDYSASVASAGNMSSVAGALLANDIVSGNHWVIVVNPDSTPVSQGTDLTVVGVTKIKIAGIQKNNGSQDGDVYNDNDLQVIGEWSDISVTSYIDITDETWEPPVNAIVPLHTIEVKAE